jgi:ribosomal protein S18 acetylase RimI-like enzyme
LNEPLHIRSATADDLPFIVALESRPAFEPFINRWPVERHARALKDEDHRYLVCEVAGAVRGYAILAGLTSPNASVQLVRIAVDAPGAGVGRRFCEMLLAEVFDRLGAHRFHLDLFEDNSRAERLYESLGFRHEGRLLEAERRGTAYRSLKLMAMLEAEYRALRGR